MFKKSDEWILKGERGREEGMEGREEKKMGKCWKLLIVMMCVF